MDLISKLRRVFREGASLALAPAPDPRVTHKTTHQRQRALLDQVAAAGRDVALAKQRLQAAADGVRAKLPAMEQQAREELREGGETTARLTLQRRQVVMNELATLERQLAEVEREGIALAMVEQRLSGQIEAFSARQEVIRARFSAAEAQVRINEAMTGVTNDLAELTATLRHAERTTEEMQARATAIDRLVADGDLDSLTFERGAAVDVDVEAQLRALRDPER